MRTREIIILIISIAVIVIAVMVFTTTSSKAQNTKEYPKNIKNFVFNEKLSAIPANLGTAQITIHGTKVQERHVLVYNNQKRDVIRIRLSKTDKKPSRKWYTKAYEGFKDSSLTSIRRYHGSPVAITKKYSKMVRWYTRNEKGVFAVSIQGYPTVSNYNKDNMLHGKKEFSENMSINAIVEKPVFQWALDAYPAYWPQQ